MTELTLTLPKYSPHNRTALSDEKLVAVRVLEQLGRPKNLYRINAEKLWDNFFRVNVYCSESSNRLVNSVRMTESFFVRLTSNGIESDPPIVRVYE